LPDGPDYGYPSLSERLLSLGERIRWIETDRRRMRIWPELCAVVEVVEQTVEQKSDISGLSFPLDALAKRMNEEGL
jgi:hypothetical protein